MEEQHFEVFVPVTGVVEEIEIVRWAYDNLKPISWAKDTAIDSGILVRFEDLAEALAFKAQYSGFFGNDFDTDLKLFHIDGLDIDAVRTWCEENAQGDWRLVVRRRTSRLIMESDEDAMLFRLSFD